MTPISLRLQDSSLFSSLFAFRVLVIADVLQVPPFVRPLPRPPQSALSASPSAVLPPEECVSSLDFVRLHFIHLFAFRVDMPQLSHLFSRHLEINVF